MILLFQFGLVASAVCFAVLAEEARYCGSPALSILWKLVAVACLAALTVSVVHENRDLFWSMTAKTGAAA